MVNRIQINKNKTETDVVFQTNYFTYIEREKQEVLGYLYVLVGFFVSFSKASWYFMALFACM